MTQTGTLILAALLGPQVFPAGGLAGMALSMPLPRDRGRDAIVPALGLAAHLAKARVFLGVTPAQNGLWQDYAQALIGFLAPRLPESAFSRGNARAGTTRALLKAAGALCAALDPQQLDRLQHMDRDHDPRQTQPPMAL